MGKLLKAVILILIFALFCVTRFENINRIPVGDDTFSWLYRINLYPWVVSSNLKGIDLGDKDLAYAGKISYHPGVTIMTFSGISTKIGKAYKKQNDPAYEQCAYLDLNCKYLDYELFIAKFPLVLISGLLFITAIYFLSEIFSLKAILPWVFVVIYEPILLSASQDLHLDFLFAMFSIAAVSALLYGVKFGRNWAIFVGGLLMGLALLTRFAGSFMIPGILGILIYLDAKKAIKNSLIFGIGGVIAFFLFYPPMWVVPYETLNYIISESAGISDNLYGVVPAHIKYLNNFMWYSGIFAGVISTFLLIFWAAGIGGLFTQVKNRRFVYSILIIYLTYFAFVNLADKQYIRYLVPIIIGVSVPASVGAYNLFNLVLILLNSKINSRNLQN